MPDEAPKPLLDIPALQAWMDADPSDDRSVDIGLLPARVAAPPLAILRDLEYQAYCRSGESPEAAWKRRTRQRPGRWVEDEPLLTAKEATP